MTPYLDCLSCVIKRAADSVKQAGLKKDLQEKVMRKVLATLAGLNLSNGPAEMIQKAFAIIREVGGINDPLENVKSYCMDVALRAYPELKHTLEKSDDSFATAVRIAMAGNIIDHSREEKQDTVALFKSIEDSLTRPLVVNHIDALREEIEKASKILYLSDNAGETVFDRILIEEMPRDRIIYAVRSAPVSNDATYRDAAFAGLTEIVEVVEDGSDYPCVILDKCSDEFRTIFDSADLIVSKGQGNLKSLSNLDKNIFFLVRVRCTASAQQFKLSVGDFLVKGLIVKN